MYISKRKAAKILAIEMKSAEGLGYQLDRLGGIEWISFDDCITYINRIYDEGLVIWGFEGFDNNPKEQYYMPIMEFMGGDKSYFSREVLINIFTNHKVTEVNVVEFVVLRKFNLGRKKRTIKLR